MTVATAPYHPKSRRSPRPPASTTTQCRPRAQHVLVRLDRADLHGGSAGRHRAVRARAEHFARIHLARARRRRARAIAPHVASAEEARQVVVTLSFRLIGARSYGGPLASTNFSHLSGGGSERRVEQCHHGDLHDRDGQALDNSTRSRRSKASTCCSSAPMTCAATWAFRASTATRASPRPTRHDCGLPQPRQACRNRWHRLAPHYRQSVRQGAPIFDRLGPDVPDRRRIRRRKPYTRSGRNNVRPGRTKMIRTT